MDDAHIAAACVAHRICVLHLQLRHRLVDQVHGQLRRLVQIRTAGHRRLRAARADLGCIDHVGAAAQDIPHNGVHGSAGLACQHAGGLHHVVVDGGQLHHVGQGHPAAVLVHLSGHRAHGQCLAFRGHSLGQRGQCLGQRLILAKLNGLAIVRRNGVAVAKLVMHQRRQRLIDQALLIKGFHLRGHTAGAGGVLQLCCHLLQLLVQRAVLAHPLPHLLNAFKVHHLHRIQRRVRVRRCKKSQLVALLRRLVLGKAAEGALLRRAHRNVEHRLVVAQLHPAHNAAGHPAQLLRAEGGILHPAALAGNAVHPLLVVELPHQLNDQVALLRKRPVRALQHVPAQLAARLL